MALDEDVDSTVAYDPTRPEVIADPYPLLRRLPGLELANGQPEWLESFVLRGVKSLPLAFEGAGA